MIKANNSKFLDRTGNCLLAMIPVVGFILFGLIPMVLSIYMSFTDLKLPIISEGTWIGFNNYKKSFQDKEMYRAFLHTLEYVLTAPLSMIL